MLSFERLTARNKNGLAYLVNVKPNEQEVNSPHKNTLKCILDCFERLAQYEDEAIARQSVKSEDVAEAIPVVRCKECGYYTTGYPALNHGTGWCDKMDRGVHDDFYCSYGERRK